MIMISLADHRRVAVRPSGTEPKIKFYMFARREPGAGARFTSQELAIIKQETQAALDALWSWIQQDVTARLS